MTRVSGKKTRGPSPRALMALILVMGALAASLQGSARGGVDSHEVLAAEQSRSGTDADSRQTGPEEAGPEKAGDGDSTGDGDDDPGERDCTPFTPAVLNVGSNEVEVGAKGPVIASACGAGPAAFYRFTAPTDGTWTFTVDEPKFQAVLSLAVNCQPLIELACSKEDPPTSEQQFDQGDRVFVIVISSAGSGTATLDVSTE